jgi:hypothetical protein
VIANVIKNELIREEGNVHVFTVALTIMMLQVTFSWPALGHSLLLATAAQAIALDFCLLFCELLQCHYFHLLPWRKKLVPPRRNFWPETLLILELK